MRIAVVLLAVCAFEFALCANWCSVGNWGEWSSCKTGLRKIDGSSRQMSVEERSHMNGRQAMQESMRRKMAARQKRVDCRADDSCPQISSRTTEGAAECVDGFAGNFPWPCSNVNLHYHIDLADLGYPEANVEGNDMWVWHDVDNSEEYVIIGTSHGSSFVRVTDPTAPEVLAIMRTHTVPSLWRDPKVLGNYAYVVSEAPDHGLQVFDLTRLRGLSASDGIQELEADAHYAGFGQAHNVAVNVELERVYVIGSTSGNLEGVCGGGWHVIDVSDPLNPVGVGCAGEDGYVHDTECIVYDGPDSRYMGQDICFGYNEETLTIFDMTDSENPLQLSRVGYDNYAYTHQGWLSAGGRWLLLDDELDEMVHNPNTVTRVFDVADLQNPTLVHVYESSETACDHNQYVTEDNLVYQANYEAGLRILELNEADGTLSELAYFDVHPTSTNPQFNGAWSTYPWLAGNTVAISSFEYGLFLVDLDLEAVQKQKESGVKVGEQHRFRQNIRGNNVKTCPKLVERRECTPEV